MKVANERLRLEVGDMKSAAGKPDPRLRALEEENRRLREQLAAAREERDSLREGVQEALQEMKRASR